MSRRGRRKPDPAVQVVLPFVPSKIDPLAESKSRESEPLYPISELADPRSTSPSPDQDPLTPEPSRAVGTIHTVEPAPPNADQHIIGTNANSRILTHPRASPRQDAATHPRFCGAVLRQLHLLLAGMKNAVESTGATPANDTAHGASRGSDAGRPESADTRRGDPSPTDDGNLGSLSPGN